MQMSAFQLSYTGGVGQNVLLGTVHFNRLTNDRLYTNVVRSTGEMHTWQFACLHSMKDDPPGIDYDRTDNISVQRNICQHSRKMEKGKKIAIFTVRLSECEASEQWSLIMEVIWSSDLGGLCPVWTLPASHLCNIGLLLSLLAVHSWY